MKNKHQSKSLEEYRRYVDGLAVREVLPERLFAYMISGFMQLPTHRSNLGHCCFCDSEEAYIPVLRYSAFPVLKKGSRTTLRCCRDCGEVISNAIMRFASGRISQEVTKLITGESNDTNYHPFLLTGLNLRNDDLVSVQCFNCKESMFTYDKTYTTINVPVTSEPFLTGGHLAICSSCEEDLYDHFGEDWRGSIESGNHKAYCAECSQMYLIDIGELEERTNNSYAGISPVRDYLCPDCAFDYLKNELPRVIQQGFSFTDMKGTAYQWLRNQAFNRTYVAWCSFCSESFHIDGTINHDLINEIHGHNNIFACQECISLSPSQSERPILALRFGESIVLAYNDTSTLYQQVVALRLNNTKQRRIIDSITFNIKPVRTVLEELNLRILIRKWSKRWNSK